MTWSTKPPTAVGGWFRSSLVELDSLQSFRGGIFHWKNRKFRLLPFVSEAGSEQSPNCPLGVFENCGRANGVGWTERSPNCSWGFFKTQSILEFIHSFYRVVVLACSPKAHKYKAQSTKTKGQRRFSMLKTPRIGFHAPNKGGLHTALLKARELDCGTVQMFSRNPRGWKAKPLSEEEADLFKQVRKKTKISPVVIHVNYLINLAAADDEILAKSRESFREELERGILLGADYLVVHPGSARGACETDGIAQCGESLKIAADELDLSGLRILLENTAGQGECIGHRFEHLGKIMDLCPELSLGVCFDTAHAFTSGYDI